MFHHHRTDAFGWRSRHSMLMFLCLLLTLLSFKGNDSFAYAQIGGEEEQVKWTANEERQSLPMSMKQRQQLLKLQQTIEQSPNPESVLQQVAQANQMSPQDLVSMLQQNAQDLQQDPNLLKQVMAGPVMGPQVVMKAFGSLGMFLVASARKHPTIASIAVLSLTLLLYMMITVPQTGGVVSTRRGGLALSKGPTTWFEPPTKYLTKRLERLNSILEDRAVSVKTKKTRWDDLLMEVEDDDVDDDTDGNVAVFVHKLKRGDELVQAISAQESIDPREFLKAYSDKDDEGKSEDDNDDDEEGGIKISDGEVETVMDLLLEHVATTLATKQLTEFVSEESPTPLLKFVPSPVGRQRFGILVVPRLGDWGRFGLTYWQVTRNSESESSSTMTLTTLKGLSHIDGQLHIVAEKRKNGLVLKVHFVVPRKGKKINVRKGEALVSTLVSSLATSTRRRTQQALARQSTSSRYQGKARSRATQRRHQRFQKEKEIEEMAEDRRRRWQRNNPDAGRYRPSNRRQQSPNNC